VWRGAVLSVAGGKVTVSALCHALVLDKMSYVSTISGSFFEWPEGTTLPGVAALTDAQKAGPSFPKDKSKN
jgi:phosphoglycerate kinase